jgi:hypothetical protein
MTVELIKLEFELSFVDKYTSRPIAYFWSLCGGRKRQNQLMQLIKLEFDPSISE